VEMTEKFFMSEEILEQVFCVILRHKGLNSLKFTCSLVHSVSRFFTPTVIQRPSRIREKSQ